MRNFQGCKLTFLVGIVHRDGHRRFLGDRDDEFNLEGAHWRLQASAALLLTCTMCPV